MSTSGVNVPFGWEGSSQRPTDRTPNLTSLIQMGARPYAPQTGRFLAVDPVEGGATTNAYGYVNDPVNTEDLNGQCMFGKRKGGGCKGGIRPLANTFNAGKRAAFATGRGAQRGVSAARGFLVSQYRYAENNPYSGISQMKSLVRQLGDDPLEVLFNAMRAVLACASGAATGSLAGVLVGATVGAVVGGLPGALVGAGIGSRIGAVLGCVGAASYSIYGPPGP